MWFRALTSTSDMLVIRFQLYLKISFPETDWVVGADNTDWCHPRTLHSPSTEGMLLNVSGLGDAMNLALYPCHSTKGKKHCYCPFVVCSAKCSSMLTMHDYLFLALLSVGTYKIQTDQCITVLPSKGICDQTVSKVKCKWRKKKPSVCERLLLNVC